MSIFKMTKDENGDTVWVRGKATGVNNFSGTDLRMDIHHPGVVFGLSTGEDIPNFASIMQHGQQQAELIHSEYRIFNGVENGERAYQKGRCLTIVKGIPTVERNVDEIPNGVIDEIFGTTRPQPAIEIQKVRPSFWLRDGLSETEGKDIGEELMALWEDCEFEIDVSLVLKTNILRGAGRLQKANTKRIKGSWGNENWGKESYGNINQYNNSLFGEEYDLTTTDTNEILSLSNMIDFLVGLEYSRKEMGSWTIQEIADTYNIEYADQQADAVAGIPRDATITDIRKDIISLIVEDKITSREKLMMMSDENLVKFVEEIYGKGIIAEIGRGEH